MRLLGHRGLAEALPDRPLRSQKTADGDAIDENWPRGAKAALRLRPDGRTLRGPSDRICQMSTGRTTNRKVRSSDHSNRYPGVSKYGGSEAAAEYDADFDGDEFPFELQQVARSQTPKSKMLTSASAQLLSIPARPGQITGSEEKARRNNISRQSADGFPEIPVSVFGRKFGLDRRTADRGQDIPMRFYTSPADTITIIIGTRRARRTTTYDRTLRRDHRSSGPRCGSVCE